MVVALKFDAVQMGLETEVPLTEEQDVVPGATCPPGAVRRPFLLGKNNSSSRASSGH